MSTEIKKNRPRGKGKSSASSTPPLLPKMVTITKAAADMGIHRTSIYAAIKKGELPIYALSTRPNGAPGTNRILLTDLQEWIQSKRRVHGKSE